MSLFSIFVLLSFTEKDNKKTVPIFMDIDYKGEKNLYDQPGGSVIKNLKHNLEEEDYIGFNIISRNDSVFYVEAYYSIKGFISKGWIKKDKYLGIYARNYDVKMKLYKEPNINSKVLWHEEYNPSMYEVIDSSGEWLKIKVVTKNKTYEGWIPPEMQCANVYSTCS